MKKLLLAFVILLLAFPVYGADYYFSNGGDGSSCLSGSPCSNIGYVQSKINAHGSGETVNIYFERGSTFTVPTNASGYFDVSESSPTVHFDAYGDAGSPRPIIDGQVTNFDTFADEYNKPPCNYYEVKHCSDEGDPDYFDCCPDEDYEYWNGLFRIRGDGHSIKNLEIRNYYADVIQLCGSNQVYSDNYIHNFGSQAIGDGTCSVTDVTVERNLIHTGQQLYRVSNGTLGGEWWGGAVGFHADEIIRDNLIKRNVIYDIFGEGIFCDGSICEENIIGDTGSSAIHATTSDKDAEDMIVRYNFIIASGDGDETYKYLLSGSDYDGIVLYDERNYVEDYPDKCNPCGDNSNATWSVYGNTIINRAAGIWLYKVDDLGTANIYNNTVINSYTANYILGSNIENIGSGILYNNISYMEGGSGVHVLNWGGSTSKVLKSNNLFNGGGVTDCDNDISSEFNNNCINGDPGFSGSGWSSTSGDYVRALDFSDVYPPSGSPVIASGISLSGLERTFLATGTTFSNLPTNPTFYFTENNDNSLGAAARGGAVQTDTTPPVVSNATPTGSQSCPSSPQNITIGVNTSDTTPPVTCKYCQVGVDAGCDGDVPYDSLNHTYDINNSPTHQEPLSLDCDASYTLYTRCVDSASTPNKNTISTTTQFSIAAEQIGGDYFYFSNSSGSDSNYPCTDQNNPCQSISQINSLIVSKSSSDVVNIKMKRGDVWTIDTKAGGTSDKGIIIPRGDNPVVHISDYGSGNKPTINGNAYDHSTPPVPDGGSGPYRWDNVLSIQKDGSTVTNIRFEYCMAGGIHIGDDSDGATNYVQIKNCELYYMGSYAINASIYHGASYTVIDGNHMERLGELYRDGNIGGDDWPIGVTLQPQPGNQGNACYNEVRNNILLDVAGEGFHGIQGVIENNIVGDTGSVGIYVNPFGNDPCGAIVRYNIVTNKAHGDSYYYPNADESRGIVIADEGAYGYEDTGFNGNADVEVYGNIVINRRFGIIFDDYTNSPPCSQWNSVKIYNNTVIDSEGGNYVLADYNCVESGSSYIVNNLSIRTFSGDHYVNWSGTGTGSYWTISDNAVWGSGTTESNFQPNLITGDPEIPGSNWTIQTGSDYYTAHDFSDVYPGSGSSLIGEGYNLSNLNGERTSLTTGTVFANLPSDPTFYYTENNNDSVSAAVRSTGGEDTTPPSVGGAYPSGLQGSYINPREFGVTATDPSSPVTCRFHVSYANFDYDTQGTSMSTTCDNGGTHCFDRTTALDNTYTHYVKCRDSIGNTTPNPSVTVSWTEGSVQTNPPIITDPLPSGIQIDYSNPRLFGVTATDDDPPIECRFSTNSAFAFSSGTAMDTDCGVGTGEEKLPILMVHGMGGNPSNWDSMKSYLISQGYDADDLFTIAMVDNGTLCSTQHVPQIQTRIAEILTQTGATQLDVLGHSRGGTNLINLMYWGDGSMVRNWISIAGANFMCPGLYGPYPTDRTALDAAYTAVYSLDDFLVDPQYSIIDGANNVELVSANHLTFPMNPTVQGHVLDALQGSGLNDGEPVFTESGFTHCYDLTTSPGTSYGIYVKCQDSIGDTSSNTTVSWTEGATALLPGDGLSFSDGFENNNFNLWDSTQGSISIISANCRVGSDCARSLLTNATTSSVNALKTYGLPAGYEDEVDEITLRYYNKFDTYLWPNNYNKTAEVITFDKTVSTPYEKLPILMVHGLGGSPAAWDTMIPYLVSQGYDQSLLYTIQMTDNSTQCSDLHVPQIEAKIADILSETGASKVDVIGHSRGGRNLYFLMHFGNGVDTVRNWITLGGANNLCPDQYGPIPDYATPGTSEYTSIYSTTDLIVSPEVAFVPGARNPSVSGITHAQLITSSTTLALTLEALEGNGLNAYTAVTEDGDGSYVQRNGVSVGVAGTTTGAREGEYINFVNNWWWDVNWQTATPYESVDFEQWKYIILHVKLNTPGLADGIIEMWVDGVLKQSSNTEVIRNSPDQTLGGFYINSYAWTQSGSNAYQYYDGVLLEAGDTYNPVVVVDDTTPQGAGIGGVGLGNY